MVNLDIIQLSKNPQLLRELDIEELQNLAEKNSNSQAVQLVYTMRLKQTNDFRYEQQLNRLALLTDDRSKLYHLFEDNAELEPLETKAVEELVVENLSIVQEEEPMVLPPSGDTKPAEEKAMTPQERVQKILEESRKRREEFKTIKEKAPSIKEEQKEERREPSMQALTLDSEIILNNEFTQIDEPEENKSAASLEEPLEAPKAEFESKIRLEPEPLEELAEVPVFSIEEESTLEQHSYSEWLKIMQSKNSNTESSLEITDSAEQVELIEIEETTFNLLDDSAEENIEESLDVNEPFKEKMELLDSFMQKLPDLKKKRKTNSDINNLDVGEISKGHDTLLVTETLANIYFEQQHFDKAIKAYEIMKLKYPEKSGFFASQISDIRKLINSNK